MDPPIQTEYFRSGGATILTYVTWIRQYSERNERAKRRTFMEEGARAVISFCIRSEIPAYLSSRSSAR